MIVSFGCCFAFLEAGAKIWHDINFHVKSEQPACDRPWWEQIASEFLSTLTQVDRCQIGGRQCSVSMQLKRHVFFTVSTYRQT